MEQVTIIGLDLWQSRFFQVHGATADGRLCGRFLWQEGCSREVHVWIPPFAQDGF